VGYSVGTTRTLWFTDGLDVNENELGETLTDRSAKQIIETIEIFEFVNTWEELQSPS